MLPRHLIRGYFRWTGVLFLRAQTPDLPAEYSMHAVVRVYHTTRAPLMDDDPNWRDMRKDCNISHNLNVDRSCGEEIYFTLDLPMLLFSPLHPALLRHLLQQFAGDRALLAGGHLSRCWHSIFLSLRPQGA